LLANYLSLQPAGVETKDAAMLESLTA